jgi:putative DNA primase/helicase
MGPPITSPAASSPDISKITGNTGNRGNRGNSVRKLPEIRHFKAHEPVTHDDGATGNRGNSALDPFASLTDADRARASAIPSGGGGAAGDDGDDGELTMLPCPGEVPPLSAFRFGELPEPSRVWVYRTAEGAAVAVAARYDGTGADGKPTKDVRPWTYGRRLWTGRDGKPRDRTRWHCKAPPSPRPLYGLDRLAARPGAPVLICEGEKAADAAGMLFPDHVAVTSQGGSKSPSKSDWTPLAGRAVTIWPDQDQPGARYAVTVADLAKQAGAASVRVVEVPPGWPQGWDLADDPPEGEAPGRLRELLDDSPDGTAAEMPNGFSMGRKGLFFTPEATEKNPEPPPVFIAAPFRVIGETRSDCGEAWGLLLRWHDREGRVHRWAVPRRMIHEPGNAIAGELEAAGLSCGSDNRAHDLLRRFVGAVKVPRLLLCVSRTGWHPGEGAPVFVLPGGEAFGHGAGDVILQADHASADAAYRAVGNLAGWRSGVAALAVGNHRMALFVSAAFAGPLLDVMGEPSGGVHLVGGSRTGKTTLAGAAASVYGKPSADAQLRAWRGTANGLEGTAAETSDALLILDEMGQADGREVGDVVYMLANEAGKQRASRTGSARRRASWRTLFLSTGEITLAQKMAEAGKRVMAGLEVRLVNLAADAGVGLGVFQDLHGRASPAALAEELRKAALAHHGVAARAFLARLANDRAVKGAELRETLEALRAAFIGEHVPAGATGQVRSVAGRFALIGAAGELARDYGVLPWPAGEALRAAGACFAAWLAERGSTGSGEDAAALAQVRGFFEAHGESRFTQLTPPLCGGEPAPPEVARTVNRAGFRRRTGEGEAERWEFLVLTETWKAEVCKGLDAKRTAEMLAGRGFLIRGTEKDRFTTLVRIKGEGQPRLYVISGAILGGDDGTG